MKTLIRHAEIYTLDRKNTVAEALVMENGRILRTGTEAELREYYRDRMEEIDCGGGVFCQLFMTVICIFWGMGFFWILQI